jgi:hypothetical protein
MRLSAATAAHGLRAAPVAALQDFPPLRLTATHNSFEGALRGSTGPARAYSALALRYAAERA